MASTPTPLPWNATGEVVGRTATGGELPPGVVGWLRHPPGWVVPGIIVGVVLVIAVGAYLLSTTDWRLTIDEQREIQSTVAIVLTVTAATLLLVDVSGSIVVSVGVAVPIGVTAVSWPAWPGGRTVVARVASEDDERLMAGWVALIVFAVVCPSLVLDWSSVAEAVRQFAIGVSGTMVIYNVLAQK